MWRFFEKCHHARKHKLPEYEGRSLMYGNHIILNVNDPAHCQKNLVRAVRSRSRLFVVYGLHLTRAPQLCGQIALPVHSYQGKDAQSDNEAAWALNPATVPETWDSSAVLLWQQLAARIQYKPPNPVH